MGCAIWPRPARMAPGVLGDVIGRNRQAFQDSDARHSRRRDRFDFSASRKRNRAPNGQPFARHWVHGEFLNVRGTKMSKRHGNFLTARDLREQGVDAAAVRLLFFQTHYRQPVDFTDEALEAAKEGVRRLGEFHQRLRGAGSRERGAELDTLAEKLEADVATALNDDLNAPRAVAALFDFVRAANRELDKPVVPGGTARELAARGIEIEDTPQGTKWRLR